MVDSCRHSNDTRSSGSCKVTIVHVHVNTSVIVQVPVSAMMIFQDLVKAMMLVPVHVNTAMIVQVLMNSDDSSGPVNMTIVPVL